MLDEWTSRLLWLDPNDNELAPRFRLWCPLLFERSENLPLPLYCSSGSENFPFALFTVRAGARTTPLYRSNAVGAPPKKAGQATTSVSVSTLQSSRAVTLER